MPVSGTMVVVLTALTGIPISYSINVFKDFATIPAVILALGGVVLLLVAAIPYLYVKSHKGLKVDPYYNVWSVFAFACVIDLIIALENEGIINSFMAFYLLEGEPYLKTTHGTYINYWDGIGHFTMYIIMLNEAAYTEKYRNVGLYWAGSITNSMFILLPAGIIGDFGVRWPILLNTPYLVIPIYLGYKFLTRITDKKYRKHLQNTKVDDDVPSIWDRPKDFCYVIFFAAAIIVNSFRAFAALGCPAEMARDYVTSYEPYLVDTVAYPKVQMLVYLFYFVPYYVFAIYGLLYPCGQTWMKDWSLIHAGAAGQAQFTHIGASLHSSTAAVSRVPNTGSARLAFWLINGVLFIAPQLFAYRCLCAERTNISRKCPERNGIDGGVTSLLSSPYNTRSKNKKDLLVHNST